MSPDDGHRGEVFFPQGLEFLAVRLGFGGVSSVVHEVLEVGERLQQSGFQYSAGRGDQVCGEHGDVCAYVGGGCLVGWVCEAVAAAVLR